MPKDHVGHLSAEDPLYNCLRHDILPQMGITGQPVDFRVFSMQTAKVYLYEEKYSHAMLVGKFFTDKGGRDGGKAAGRMWREFNNLQILRTYGLTGYPHHVVRPLGVNTGINSVLIEEYCLL